MLKILNLLTALQKKSKSLLDIYRNQTKTNQVILHKTFSTKHLEAKTKDFRKTLLWAGRCKFLWCQQRSVVQTIVMNCLETSWLLSSLFKGTLFQDEFIQNFSKTVSLNGKKGYVATTIQKYLLSFQYFCTFLITYIDSILVHVGDVEDILKMNLHV